MELEVFRRQFELHANVTMTIRVRTRAKLTAVQAVMGDGSVKIALAAPTESGKANAELMRFLSKAFKVPLSSVKLLSGRTSRKKIVRIIARFAP